MLPLAYLIYHLVGFENGINAYIHKVKILKNKQIQQEELKNEIDYYKTKLLLLDDHDVNIDFLEEKSYELGESPKNSFTVTIK